MAMTETLVEHDDEHQAALAAVSRRIHLEHQEVELPVIEQLLRDALAETQDAKVQNFRILLAERDVRRRLRGDLSCDQPG